MIFRTIKKYAHYLVACIVFVLIWSETLFFNFIAINGDLKLFIKGVHGSVQCKGRTCTCPQNPITERYPDPSDSSCENYYLCHMGNAFHKRCDVRQAFHPEKRVCLSRSRVPFTNCKTAVTCDKNGYFADPRDCTKYFLCFYQQSYHYGCKVKHYFNPTQVKCILNETISQNCNIMKTTTPKKLISVPTKPPPLPSSEIIS